MINPLKKSALALLLSIFSLCASAQANQQLRDSLSAATELLSYHPDSLELRMKKASWNVQLEQWDYAKSEYDYVIGREPANIAARYYRAFVNEKLRRYSFARLDYEAVLTIVPGNFEATLGLALLNQKDNHHTEALDLINRLVDNFPDSAVAYAARAGIEKERKMLTLADYDFEQASKLDPDNVDYKLNRIELLIAMKRNDEALRILNALSASGFPMGQLRKYYKEARKS